MGFSIRGILQEATGGIIDGHKPTVDDTPISVDDPSKTWTPSQAANDIVNMKIGNQQAMAQPDKQPLFNFNSQQGDVGTDASLGSQLSSLRNGGAARQAVNYLGREIF